MSIRNIVNTIERKVIAAKKHSVGKEKAEMVEKLTHCDGPMMLRTEIWSRNIANARWSITFP